MTISTCFLKPDLCNQEIEVEEGGDGDAAEVNVRMRRLRTRRNTPALSPDHKICDHNLLAFIEELGVSSL